jgi:hypothetical protein
LTTRLREFAVFLGISALAALAMFPFRAGMRAALEQREDALISRFEDAAGLTLDWDSAGFSLLNSLDVRNLTLSREDEALVQAKRVRVSYSLASLLSGGGILSVKKIIIEKPVVCLKLPLLDSDDTNVSIAKKKYSEIYALIFPYIPEGVEIIVRGGEVYAQSETANFSAGNISFKLIHSHLISAVVSANARAELSNKQKKGTAQNFSAALRIGAFFSPKTAAFRVGVRGFNSPNINVSKTDILFTLNDNSVSLQKINDRRPYDIHVSYNLNNKTYKAALSADNFMPSAILSFKGNLQKLGWSAQSALSGELEIEGEDVWTGGGFSGSISDAPLSYKADINIALAESSPAGKSRVRLKAEGTQKQVTIHNALFNGRNGELSYKGTFIFDPLTPNGTLEMRQFKPFSKGSAGIDASFAISGRRRNITVFADTVMIGGVEFQGVNADFIRAGTEYTWTASALRFIDNGDDVHISNIDADGTLDTRGKNLEANIKLNAIALADVLGIMNLTADMKGAEKNPLARNVFFTTEIFFNTDFKHFAYTVPSFVAAFQGQRNGFAVASMSGTDQFFDLSSGRFVWNDGSLDFLARADFSGLDDISFSVDCSLRDISYYINGSILDKTNVRITGSYGFEFLASVQKNGFSGFFKTDMFPLPSGGGVSYLALDTDFRFVSASSWNVNIQRMEITGGGALLASNTLRLSGFANNEGLSIPMIYLNKPDGALYGDALAAWNFADGDKRLSGRLSLGNGELSERFTLDCRYMDGEFNLRADALNFQSGWLYRSGLNANLSGTFAFKSNNGIWDSSFEIYSLAMNAGGGILRLSTRGTFDAARFSLGDTSLTYNALQSHFSNFDIDLETHTLSTEFSTDGYIGKKQIRFDAALLLEFAETQSWTSIKRMTQRINATLAFQKFNYDKISINEPFTFNFTKNGTLLSASGGPNNMLLARMDGEGTLFASFSKPSPIRGAVFGSLRGGEIDIEGNGLYIEMDTIWDFVPLEIIDFTSGIVSADIHIQGPAGDPSFYGSANGNSISLLIPSYVNGTIGPAPVTLTFRGAEMILEPLSAPVGRTGEARLSGVFQFDRWVPRTFILNIDAEDESPIPFGIDVAGINAKGDAAGHLEIIVEENSVSVLGNLRGDNAEITLDSGQFRQRTDSAAAQQTAAIQPVSAVQGAQTTADMQPASGDGGSEKEVVTEITIQTGRKVEFLWPNPTIPILKATAYAGDSIQITSNSLSGVFSIKGDVRLRSGEMYYFQRNFYLRSGILTFNENESQFDPRLSVRAEMRDRTADGSVTVSMIIDNQSLLSFSPRLESTPALSQAEILSILGGNLSGVNGQSGSEESNVVPFVSSGLDFAQFVGLRRFENFMRDKVLHVDMFSARTQALQNLLLFNQTQAAENAQPRAGNFFDNTSIFIGKYFSSGMFGQLMLNMRYDENRLEFSGLSLEPELMLEFNTPLFNIEWRLAIDNFEYLWTDPHAIKGLWIPNNAITITKRWTLP